MVPEGWQKSRLGDVGRIKSGATPLRSEGDRFFAETGYQWVKTMDLNNGRITSTDECITDAALKETSCSIFPIGTVLVAMYGGFNQIGRTGVLARPSAINQAISAIQLDEKRADSEYVLAFLNGHVSAWKRFAASSRKDPNITRDDVLRFPVLLPPLPEQKKIAQILSTWDQAITATERLLENSQKRKKGLMQQLLTGKKRLPGFEGEFQRRKIDELAKIDSINLGSKTRDEFEFSYISLSDVEHGVINNHLEKYRYGSAPSRARRVVSEGDLLVSTVRPNLQAFAQISGQHHGYIASTGFTVLTPTSVVCGDYMYQYLFSAHVMGQINSLVAGSNYPAISSADVKGLIIYCPELAEQKKIAKILNTCDMYILLLRRKIELLDRQKKALMQQLLTGKRRVKVDEAA